MTKRLELVANVAIIAAAVLFGTSLVRNQWWPKGPGQLTTGTKLGEGWSRPDRSLVLVLQSGCHFCSESAPFYRRLAEEARGKGVHLIAALPQPSADSRRYLAHLQVPIDDVREVHPDSLKVRGTPTLIAVDRRGVVKAVWRGKLSTDREAEVLASLQNGS